MTVAASLPYRYTSMHVCLQAGKGSLGLNKALVGVILNAYPEHARVRTRIHCGSSMELHYQLQSHGVALKTCPVDSSGGIRRDVMNVWYPKHLAYMQSKGFPIANLVDSSMLVTISSTSSAVTMVRSNDVLLGRGKGSQDHPGNIRFREFLDGYSDVYDKAPRKERRVIATELSSILSLNGVRFLKQNEAKEWVESDAPAIEAKIGQLFRSIRKKSARSR